MTVRTLEEILETDGILTDTNDDGIHVPFRTVLDDIVIKGHTNDGEVFRIREFVYTLDKWFPIAEGTTVETFKVFTIYRLTEVD